MRTKRVESINMLRLKKTKDKKKYFLEFCRGTKKRRILCSLGEKMIFKIFNTGINQLDLLRWEPSDPIFDDRRLRM